MPMIRKTITIPDSMEAWVKAQVESGRYANDSEYLRDLIRRDQDRRRSEQEMRDLIREGLESGVSGQSMAEIVREVDGRYRIG